jgi:hypothetical protein
MQVKRSKILGKIIILSLITATTTYANNKDNLYGLNNKDNTTLEKSYQHMNTAQLEKEVEKLCKSGNLPFYMGVELIKRWTKN